LLQNVPTVCTVIPEIPPDIEDLVLGIAAAPGVPEVITYTNEIKMLEFYSDKLLKISQKNSSMTWGNKHSLFKVHELFASSPKPIQS